VNDSTWTWISGDNSANQSSVVNAYLSTTFATSPSAREHAVGWYDSFTQELWLFGGEGIGDKAIGAHTYLLFEPICTNFSLIQVVYVICGNLVCKMKHGAA